MIFFRIFSFLSRRRRFTRRGVTRIGYKRVKVSLPSFLPRSFAAASGLLLKTKAFLYSRALFFPCCQFSDKALCTFWSRSGSLHGAACSVLAEQRRNEASSSRAGGRRLAVRRYRLATSGLQAAWRDGWSGVGGMQVVVSRHTRPQAARAKRSAYLISFPLNSAPDGAE